MCMKTVRYIELEFVGIKNSMIWLGKSYLDNSDGLLDKYSFSVTIKQCRNIYNLLDHLPKNITIDLLWVEFENDNEPLLYFGKNIKHVHCNLWNAQLAMLNIKATSERICSMTLTIDPTLIPINLEHIVPGTHITLILNSSAFVTVRGAEKINTVVLNAPMKDYYTSNFTAMKNVGNFIIGDLSGDTRVINAWIKMIRAMPWCNFYISDIGYDDLVSFVMTYVAEGLTNVALFPSGGLQYIIARLIWMMEPRVKVDERCVESYSVIRMTQNVSDLYDLIDVSLYPATKWKWKWVLLTQCARKN